MATLRNWLYLSRDGSCYDRNVPINPSTLGTQPPPLAYMAQNVGRRRSWVKVILAISVALACGAISVCFTVRYVVKNAEMQSLSGSFCGTCYAADVQQIDPQPARDASLGFFAGGAALVAAIGAIRYYHDGSDFTSAT
jgi:hypothetical protein